MWDWGGRAVGGGDPIRVLPLRQCVLLSRYRGPPAASRVRGNYCVCQKTAKGRAEIRRLLYNYFGNLEQLRAGKKRRQSKETRRKRPGVRELGIPTSEQAGSGANSSTGAIPAPEDSPFG